MKLAATAYGSGRFGVALFHESDTSQEVWRDYAPRLASHGLLVLAIDARGHGGSQDVAGSSGAAGYGLDGEAAVAWLRAHGATRVALVGASIGGTMALTTAERTGAAAAVSLSGPATDHGQLDAVGGAAHAPRKVLLVVGSSDRDFTQDAQDLAHAVPKAELVTVDTSDHGTALLPDPAPAGGTIADLVTAFVLGALGTGGA